ncbi:MAG: phenylacetate--CoA ligase family protein [Parcubacteria group bacterium]|nr:phenylacetate--CoA ligase family protein [Parcubacteria group bacterium]
MEKMTLVKNLAKKIICAAPLSVELSGNFKLLFELFSPSDKIIQDWVLRQTDFFSENDWEEIQLIKLKKILIHAGENVSYWQKLFKEINFNPETFKDFSQLQKISPITRAEIKKNPIEEFTAENISRWRFREAITSGSTGEPLKFFQDLRDNLRREVNTFHELRYAGASYRDHIAVLGMESHHDLNNFGRRFGSAEWGDDKFRQSVIYPYLKLKPATLIANGSDLRRFLFLTRKEAPDVIFKTLMYRGEHIRESERDNISRFFKCPIFTNYGSRECSLLGIECEYHKLHLAPWMNYFEIVSDDGKAVPDGQEGNAVVTFFENFVVPFIRYKIGDKAAINSELCFCGRKSKIIAFSGRESDFIKFPDSSKSLSILDLARRIDENYYNEIRQYQFELRSEKLIVFRYIPNADLTETEKKRLSGLLEEALECQFHVVLEETAAINPSAGGKTQILIRNL